MSTLNTRTSHHRNPDTASIIHTGTIGRFWRSVGSKQSAAAQFGGALIITDRFYKSAWTVSEVENVAVGRKRDTVRNSQLRASLHNLAGIMKAEEAANSLAATCPLHRAEPQPASAVWLAVIQSGSPSRGGSHRKPPTESCRSLKGVEPILDADEQFARRTQRDEPRHGGKIPTSPTAAPWL